MKQIDTGAASTLLTAASALRLLGTRTILTGIQPDVAQALIGLGIDLNKLVTCSTLQSGIAYALRLTRTSRSSSSR